MNVLFQISRALVNFEWLKNIILANVLQLFDLEQKRGNFVLVYEGKLVPEASQQILQGNYLVNFAP